MDREKIINDLVFATVITNANGSEYVALMPQTVSDIIGLLKEQEAVEPYHVNTNHEQHWKCGNCNAVISVQDKYCSTCGKPILWEGR